jgi:hypothetical protein
MKISRKLKAVLILSLVVILLVGVTLFVLLKPGQWTDEIVTYLNENILVENGWRISIEKIEGQLTSDIDIHNLYLRKIDGSAVFYTEYAKVNFDLSQILVGKWAISRVRSDNALLTIDQTVPAEITELNFVTDLTRKGFRIRELSLGRSALIVREDEDESLYDLSFDGRIDTRSGKLVINPAKFRFADLKGANSLWLAGGEFALSATGLVAKEVTGNLNQLHFEFSSDIGFYPDTKILLDATVHNIITGDYVNQDVLTVLNADTVNLQFQLETDLVNGVVDGLVYNSRTYDIVSEVDLDVTRKEDTILLNRSAVRIGTSEVTGEGNLTDNKAFLLNISIDKLDLASLNLLPESTHITGMATLEGSFDDNSRLERVAARLRLQNDKRGDERFVRISGGVTYAAGIIEITDSLTVDLGYGVMSADGKMNLEDERIDVILTTKDANLQSLAYVFGWPDSLAGQLKGSVDLTGYLRDPSVKGILTFSDGVFGTSMVSSLSASFFINSLIENRQGSLRAVAKDGKTLGYLVDEGTVDLYFRGDTVMIASVRLDGENNYLQASGKIVGSSSIIIDQLQASLRDQYLSTAEKVVIRQQDDGFVVEPATIRINDGSVQGSLLLKDGTVQTGKMRVVNLNLDALERLLQTDFLITGSTFAQLDMMNVDGDLVVDGTLDIKDGQWNEIPFSDLILTGDLRNDQVSIREMRMLGVDGMTMELSGYLGSVLGEDGRLEIDPEGDIEFSSAFKNLDLVLLADYLPQWWNLRGKATGSLAMSGKAMDSEMIFQLTIIEPQLDRIHAQKISASGRYMDHRLFFEDMEGFTATGHYTGEGYIPAEFDLIAEDEDRFMATEPISISFRAETSNLDFLTPYFADVDSIKGDFSIDLSINGTPVNPVRNGRISVENGIIYPLYLDVPISQMSGSAILKDNKFMIEEVTAASHMPANVDWAKDLRSGLSRISGGIFFAKEGTSFSKNIQIKGSMDMEQFFSPNLAFLISGEDVYVRTLLGEIEGIADVDLSVTGQDTLSIVGDIIPSEAVLRMEFTDEGDFEDAKEAGAMVTHYDLHFPIAGNLFIRNSQIDAELEGDMTITRLGNEPYRYAGELTVAAGKFYYGTDNFDIQEGYLSFDPTEFNPRMDIRATTTISDVDILVSLTGEFDDPTLIIEDSEQFFSQGDLLQMLTIQRRFEDEDFSTESISEQSVYIFGKYLKNELERSLVRSTPVLDELEIEGSETILNPSDDSDLAVKVGTRLSSNLYLSYKQNFSLTQPNQVGVEYRLNRNVSLVVTYDEDGQVHLKYRRKYQF